WLAVALHLHVDVLGVTRLVAGRHDGAELVPPLLITALPAVVLVADHVVVALFVRGPDLDDGARDRGALGRQHAAAERDAVALVVRLDVIAALRRTEAEVGALDLRGRRGQLAGLRRRRLADLGSGLLTWLCLRCRHAVLLLLRL